MLYLMAVTDGSAICNMSLFRTEDLRESERVIRLSYQSEGPRSIWESCCGRMDLEAIISFAELSHVPVYLLDCGQWTKYSEDENGKFSWKEIWKDLKK